MKKIIALAGSNSKQSINKALATYAANQIEGATVQVLDLNDFPMPIYSIDIENESGIPAQAHELLNQLNTANGLVISLAEHNGSYAAVFKNVYDWMSRIQKEVWNNTPMLLMATSPGARGGQTVLNMAKSGFPYLGGNIVAHFSLPSFGSNFTPDGIADTALASDLKTQLNSFEQAVKG